MTSCPCDSPQVMKRVRTEQVRWPCPATSNAGSTGDGRPAEARPAAVAEHREMAASLTGTLPPLPEAAVGPSASWKPIITRPTLECQGFWAVPDVVCDFLLHERGQVISSLLHGPLHLTWTHSLEGQVLQTKSFGKWLEVLASYTCSQDFQCVFAFVVWNWIWIFRKILRDFPAVLLDWL